MKILLAYDGSAAAHAAILGLAKAGLPEAGQLTVLTALESETDVCGGAAEYQDLFKTVATAANRRAQASNRWLTEQATESLRRLLPAWQIGVEYCDAAPREAILDKAAAWHADLVILGANGYSTTGRNILGSVALRVLCESNCSVRIGRTTQVNGTWVRLIVGLDGSPGAQLAVEAVASRRWPPMTEVLIVAVLEEAAPAGHPIWLVSRQAAERLQAAGLTVITHIRGGEAAQVLLQEARDWQAHCLFIGATGCGNGRCCEIGDVAYAVSAKAPCPVEIVREAPINPPPARQPR
jgi:nucleotide-binding universal stress UspA family protein